MNISSYPTEMQNMKLCPFDECKGGVGFPTIATDNYLCMMCNKEFEIEKPKKPKNDKCVSCNSLRIVSDIKQGYIICMKCGIIQDSIISDEQEWNNYTAGVDKSRVGMIDYSNPFATPGSTISTAGNKHYTSYINKDGKMCYMDLRKKLIATNYSSAQKAHDCVANIINHQTRVSESIKQRAISYWAEMLKSDSYETHRNSIRRGIIFCCIYYAAITLNIPMTREEIAEKTGIKSEDMNKGDPIFRDLISNTKYKSIINLESDVSSMFERFMDSFDFDNRTKFKYAKLCKKICDDYSEFFENRKESTLVSGIMAFVFEKYKLKGEKRKIKILDVHKATSVSVPTISNLVKELRTLVEIDYYEL